MLSYAGDSKQGPVAKSLRGTVASLMKSLEREGNNSNQGKDGLGSKKPILSGILFRLQDAMADDYNTTKLG